MQTFEKWHPVPNPPAFLHGAFALQLGTNDLLVFCDGHFANGKCAVFAFRAVQALRTTQEHIPHWEADLQGTNPLGWPFLTVAGSEWARALDVFEAELVHYCIVSGDLVVEVLAERPPEMRWATGGAFDALMDAGLQLGTQVECR